MLKMYLSASFVAFCYFFILENIKATELDFSEIISRHRRQLVFPNVTVLQFNAGIGTPSPAELINVNWAIQANFQLPWNRSQIPFDVLEANGGYTGFSRKKRELNEDLGNAERDGQYESDAKLYHFYNYVEEVLNGFGQNGSSCVLQTLCKLGAEPLHPHHEDDLLHEIISFVLNPTYDSILGLKEEDEHFRYIRAYKNGENGHNCSLLYDNCSTSYIDSFTKLHDPS